MRCVFSFSLLFLFQAALIQAQDISAKVLDFHTRQPVSFATVQYAPGKGVVTNEEGNFSIYGKLSEKDTLLISSIGYETLKVNSQVHNGKDILLKPSAIELENVFLTNKNLTPEEIIQKVKENVESNYNFDLAHKKFFFRESNVNNVGRFDLIVDKSTFPDLDQALMTQISQKVPRYSDSYKEILGDFYGNYKDQKLQVIKAANLHNPQSTEGLTELVDKLENIFKENIKSNSFLKIKTGIIGVKLDAEELEFESSEEKKKKEEKETPEDIEKSREERKKNLQNSANSKIKSLLGNTFWKSDNTMDVLENSRKYRFRTEGFLQLGNEIVYVINFEPKRGATFKGKIYVNTFDYGVHRLEFQNVKTLNSFRLFGISTSKDVYRGKMIFSKDNNGKYNPGYLEIEKGESFGLHRPLKIIEKNKFVKGRRKQNELDLKIKINSGQLTKHQLVIYEDSPIDQAFFNELDSSTSFEYETFKVYNPEYWKGHNIIEPNAAIKAFTALEVEETAF
ncbi:MAG TPA: carboxypeptidase-like regulatory domain-containing protein [Gillisia sp.]|nr:carboxypeptidase-like regulatory domain-containing protein [Gillisia sp.]